MISSIRSIIALRLLRLVTKIAPNQIEKVLYVQGMYMIADALHRGLDRLPPTYWKSIGTPQEIKK